MSLTVPHEVIDATTSSDFQFTRGSKTRHGREDGVRIATRKLDEEALADLARAATEKGDAKTVKAIDAILKGRADPAVTPVPNFGAFQDMLSSYLKRDVIDGWIYVMGSDGRSYPFLVTDIKFDDGERSHRSDPKPSVVLKTTFFGKNGGSNSETLSIGTKSFSFEAGEVARRRIPDILAASGIRKETEALKAAYLKSLKRYRDVVEPAFAEQFHVNGHVLEFKENDYRRRGEVLSNRKVIQDLRADEKAANGNSVESEMFEGKDGVGDIPEHPIMRVFDLRSHEFFWVHGDAMEPYLYDATLRDRLILPRSHHDLLEVLTTDTDAFVDDLIEGKKAGNIILCKGPPGVAKTLTAEVYSEIVGKPLYAIHAGSLGTTAKSISDNMRVIFDRAVRWRCILLLDEADVFVAKRGHDLEQNAVTAEFLRSTEYFDQLMFMTTNRPDDIDDAMISRCAAIIGYDLPVRNDARQIWQVMARQFRQEMSPDLQDGLLDMFPEIAGRDIKMLFRLTLRMAAKNGEALTLDLFRKCAQFRAIKIRVADDVMAA